MSRRQRRPPEQMKEADMAEARRDAERSPQSQGAPSAWSAVQSGVGAGRGHWWG